MIGSSVQKAPTRRTWIEQHSQGLVNARDGDHQEALWSLQKHHYCWIVSSALSIVYWYALLS